MRMWQSTGMNRSLRTIVTVTVTMLLGLMVYLSVRGILHAREIRELMVDRAEIKDVRYGLLSMDAWSEKVSAILDKKIEEFQITEENSQAIAESVERILYMLIDEVEQMMEERTSGNFSEIKRWIAGLALDVDQLRDSVPSYALQIIDEVEKPENKEALTEFIEGKLEAYADSTGVDPRATLTPLLDKYDCDTKEQCEHRINSEISRLTTLHIRLVVLIILIAVIIFLGWLYLREEPGKLLSILLVLTLTTLLVSGVTSPMIALEAAIENLRFRLLGEEVVFGENILFFQSKSITDVVGILIRDGSIPMIGVGILIFSFSIIFPTLKMVASLLHQVGNEKTRSNRWIRFFVFKSGKWSMADVMVVAIFMAFIGFNGIVGNQLEQLREGAEPAKMITSNGTQLLSGFYLFLSYCLLGLLFSSRLSN